jgi:uncharacterized alpha-E superfamily protein
MLSRVAARIYWLARYLERAENTARLVNVNVNLLLDLPRQMAVGWQPLIDITGSGRLFRRLFRAPGQQNVVRFLIADLRNPGSLLNSLNLARENARTIRDVIPREGWEAVNSMYLAAKSGLPGGLAHKSRHDFLNNMIARSQHITGLLAGTMFHDAGYNFLRMGRNLERADMTSRIVDVRTDTLLPDQPEVLPPFEHLQWVSVLRSLSAYQSYQQTEQGPVMRGAVLRLLLQDTRFPRSFAHCVGEVHTCLRTLPRCRDVVVEAALLSEHVVAAPVETMSKLNLQRFIDDLQQKLARLNDTISKTYFEPPAQKTR